MKLSEEEPSGTGAVSYEELARLHDTLQEMPIEKLEMLLEFAEFLLIMQEDK